MTTRRIAIVGGGYTGLVAAWDLARRGGFAVTVLERGAALGGLAGDFTLQGASLEKTYHHIFRTDTAILELVAQLGLGDRMQWLPSSVAIRRGGRTYPFMSPLDVLRFTPVPLLGRLRLGVTMLYLKHRRNWRPFAGLTALAWMRRACGVGAAAAIWEPLLRGKFERYHDRVSMAWLWARIHIRANSRESTAGGERLGYFNGGFSVFTNRLADELRAHGVELRLGAAIERLEGGPRPTVHTAAGAEIYDAVLFTGSSRGLGELLARSGLGTEAYRAQLASIPYLGAICLVFASDQELGSHYWTNLNEPGAPFLVFINHTRLVDRAAYGGRFVYYIGAYLPDDSALARLPDEQLVRRWFDYVRELFPEFDEAHIVERHLFRFRDAQHVVEPGYEARRPEHRTPVPGLYLANFSQIYPEDRGTNYAVREGRRIAALMAGDLTAGG